MILCWEWMDESLNQTLQIMNTVPSDLYGAVQFGKVLAAVIALLVGGAEAFMMMLGKKAIDVMKLLRIAIISIAITQSANIASGVRYIFMGDGSGTGGIEGAFREQLKEQDAEIRQLDNEVMTKRATISLVIDTMRINVEKTKMAGIFGNNSFSEIVGAAVGTAKNIVNDLLSGTVAQNIYWQSSALGSGFKNIVMWIGETLFQMCYYGILVGQRAFLAVMAIFLPFVLALSLAPMYRNAWSQWLSKYISICLWGAVVFICMKYINTLMIASLKADIKDLDDIAANASVNGMPWANVKALWEATWNNMRGALYTVVVYLIGSFVIRQVPEMCSWVVPGGVSSHWGHTAGGTSQAIAMYAGAKVYQGAKAAIGVVSGGTTAAAGAAASTAAGGLAQNINSVSTGVGGDQTRGLGRMSAETPPDAGPLTPPDPPRNS